jgi:23S rRNA pseudouridine2605 synthase
MRLNQFLALSGVSSRRKADELMAKGFVQVNGQTITTLGVTINPVKDRVFLNHQEVIKPPKYTYYRLNKPVGVVATTTKFYKDPVVVDFVPPKPRVYPVGRLDKNSEGLILLTNDGELTYRLTHPKFGIIKTYRVQIDREPTPTQIKSLREGIKLAEGETSRAGVDLDLSLTPEIWLNIKIHQGWKRQIRRMLTTLGLNTRRLIRVGIGPVKLTGLTPGEYRCLTKAEISALKRVY